MAQASYDEQLITPEKDTPESKAARAQLQGVMDRLYQGYVPPVVTKGKANKSESDEDNSDNKKDKKNK